MTPIPLTIVGGYLGTGKTTLINNILKTTNKRIAVLVNDFGDINIDERLIDWKKDNILSIAGGCICCSYGNELIETLEQMKTIDPLPNHIVLEASGVAIPYKIAQTISLMEFLSLYGKIILADASRLLNQLRDKYISDTIQNQIKDNDLLVLNKIDIASELDLENCVAELVKIDDKKNILKTSKANISEQTIFQDFLNGNSKTTSHDYSERANIGKFISTTLKCFSSIDIEKLTKLLNDPKNGVERAKGFIQNEKGANFVIQFDSQNLEIKKVSEKKEAVIVVIGREGLFNKDKFIFNFNKTLT